MSELDRQAWVMRTFGSWAAYKHSLPSSVWMQTDKGYYTATRK